MKQTVLGGGFLLNIFCVTSTTDIVLLLFLDMCVPPLLLRSRIPVAILRLGFVTNNTGITLSAPTLHKMKKVFPCLRLFKERRFIT